MLQTSVENSYFALKIHVGTIWGYMPRQYTKIHLAVPGALSRDHLETLPTTALNMSP